MDRKIVFASNNRLALIHRSAVSYLDSDYLLRYRKNREDIIKRKAWKSAGTAAAVMGDRENIRLDCLDEILEKASINGIAFTEGGSKLAYSVSVENFSGIFLKELNDPAIPDGHFIHDNTTSFFNLDCHPETGAIVASVRKLSMEKHIAVFERSSPHYQLLTEGDCVEDNPVWGTAHQDTVFFDAAGIGRSERGFTYLSPKVINKLEISSGALTEFIQIPRHDCFLPKTDEEGNIYFIKKPYRPFCSSMSVKEFTLMPYKVLKAIYYWIEFFTIRHTGETLTSTGPDPARSKRRDPKQILIEGNFIDAEKTLRENRLKGEAFPGLAPRNWELMKKENSGNLVSLKKGVIDFDIARDDTIVYSNGRYVIRMNQDRSEEVLEEVELANRIRIAPSNESGRLL